MTNTTGISNTNRTYNFHREEDVKRSKKDEHFFVHPPKSLKGDTFISLDKKIQERICNLWKLIPFRGLCNYFKENKVKEIGRVKPEDICDDTAVITLNNKHAGALLGGYDKDLDKWAKSDHIILFSGIPNSQSPLTKVLEKKLELCSGVGLVAGLNFALKSLMPVNLAALTALGISTKVLEKLGMNNPVFTIFELFNLIGVSSFDLKDSTYKPIPLVGLDTNSMKKRASEIKEQEEYNLSLKPAHGLF